jgi:hypothetical protein
VKSTGPKFFVVTLPSAVIAKVAMTNGRLRVRRIVKKTSNFQRSTLNCQNSALGVGRSALKILLIPVRRAHVPA